jgi:hypothetical protein
MGWLKPCLQRRSGGINGCRNGDQPHNSFSTPASKVDRQTFISFQLV